MRFAFAIPFKPRSACVDWSSAQANLRRTVRAAARAAAVDDATIVVACHDQPDLGDAADGAVHVLPVPFVEPTESGDRGRDKARKRRFIGAWLRERLNGDSIFVMFLDADDLVRKDVVRHVLSTGHDSYLVRDAYSIDLTRLVLQHRQQGFSWARGSSFICRFARDELPTSADDLASPFSRFGAAPEQSGHAEYPRLASELGRPPEPFPFPAVVYTVNHPESTWGQRSGSRRRLEPRDVVWPSEARRILAQDFSAPDLSDKLAGLLPTLVAFSQASAARLPAKARRTAWGWLGKRQPAADPKSSSDVQRS
jgi:hypothetical protein